MRGITPAQWAVIDRLAAAGCPITCRQLLSRQYPLRIIEKMPAMGTNTLPLSSGGTGIALRLRILALSSVTVAGFSLRKRNWATVPTAWTGYCAQHAAYCFHDIVDGRAQIDSNDTLNFRILDGGCGLMKRGDNIEGHLLGTTPERLMTLAGGTLDAVLVIQNEIEEAFPFTISISTKPVLASAVVATEGS